MRPALAFLARLAAALLAAALLAAALLPVGLLASGCVEYTDRVRCSNGQVLDENDRCVAPPVPDGGVAITSCAELCAAMTAFDETQLGCIETNLSAFGPVPMECMTDLSVEASCGDCVAALALGDDSCATAGSVCR